MSIQITQVNIRTATEDLVKGYVDIVFDNCFMIEKIRIIKGPTGLFISFPARRQSDGAYRDIAFPANAETRRVIEQAVLTEYEKVVAGSDQVSSKTKLISRHGPLIHSARRDSSRAFNSIPSKNWVQTPSSLRDLEAKNQRTPDGNRPSVKVGFPK